ncbi:hypothetical protein [Leptospira santarosai]|uniref:Lipoprotein n=1 Tax=Leptospira santarosai serovar Shermani str. LT 821 TaxID=758847 RepID=K8YBV8_9LEPT|nr:hypothetical protein [Leptospira santarosai]EKT87035.1 hypothetical protein LSS_09224 [Leptospira santarosai serovar Shermani str. LT 821]EPG82143.1 putative lipoprotein [Leptospira santarosai serovar Shermani str. 1342KT]
MKNLSLVVILAAVFFGGCTVYKPSFVKTSASNYPAKPETCDFTILTILPNKPFEEIGVIENQSIVVNISDFKTMSQPYVCSQGGDAVVAFVNGHGIYIKGTIIKFKTK